MVSCSVLYLFAVKKASLHKQEHEFARIIQSSQNMKELFSNLQVLIFFELILAAFLGALVGLEREYQHKEAGLRTCSLVCLGSALFCIIGREIALGLTQTAGISFDPSRILAAVVMGVGFICAGAIIHRETRVEGLTTAASLWLVAAIGGAVASRFYLVAALATFLSLLILAGLRKFEQKFLGKQ